MSDEEPVDTMPNIRKDCEPSCTAPMDLYQACVERITKKGEGDCEQWYFDWLKCIDKCSVPKLFATLK